MSCCLLQVDVVLFLPINVPTGSANPSPFVLRALSRNRSLFPCLASLLDDATSVGIAEINTRGAVPSPV